MTKARGGQNGTMSRIGVEETRTVTSASHKVVRRLHTARATKMCGNLSRMRQVCAFVSGAAYC